MASRGHQDRSMPSLTQYEAATYGIEKIIVLMPDGRTKETTMPMLPNNAANTPRERRLGVPAETVRDRMNQLLRESSIPEATFEDYEMLITGPQGTCAVMQDNSPITAYREQLGTGREPCLEIRQRANHIPVPRDSHPEQFNYNLK